MVRCSDCHRPVEGPERQLQTGERTTFGICRRCRGKRGAAAAQATLNRQVFGWDNGRKGRAKDYARRSG